MTRFEKAVVGITYDGEDFLILKKKGSWEGWQFVQGKIDEGESEEQAVLRELLFFSSGKCSLIDLNGQRY